MPGNDETNGRRWVPWAINRTFFAASVLLAWECRNAVTPAMVLASLWVVLNPLRSPDSIDTGAAKMQHIVLVSHFQEGSFVVNRTLDAVNRAAKRCTHPVRVIHACEEKSNIARGLFEPVAMPNVSGYDRRVHPSNRPGENAGLGSNLRYAMSEEVRSMGRQRGSARDAPRVMVTKLDGNAVVPDDYLLHLESAWSREGLSSTVCFQPLISENGMHEDSQQPWTLRAFAAGNPTLNEFVFRFVRTSSPYFHSTYSMPLEMIRAAGSWDPLLVQEDQLMAQRTALALPSFKKVILGVSVYNAPPLSWKDFRAQGQRCLYHGWVANDRTLARAMRVSTPKAITLLPFGYPASVIAIFLCNPAIVHIFSPLHTLQSMIITGASVLISYRRSPEARSETLLSTLQKLALIAASQTVLSIGMLIAIVTNGLRPPPATSFARYHTTSTM